MWLQIHYVLSVDWLKAVRSLIAFHLSYSLSRCRTPLTVGLGLVWLYSVIPDHYHVPSWERDPVMCAAVWIGVDRLSPSPSLTAILNTRLCSAFNINKRSRKAGGQTAASHTHGHRHTE